MVGTTQGGEKAKKRLIKEYGEDYFKKIGKFGGKAHSGSKTAESIKKKYGEDYYKKLSQKGVEARKAVQKVDKGG